jgi:transcriptional regulator with XRE-family HTH domain
VNSHTTVSVDPVDIFGKGAVDQSDASPGGRAHAAYVADPKAIGVRIRSLRRLAGLTQVDVADALGVARSTLGEMENGTNRGSHDTLLAIADFFRVPLDWLLCRTVPPGGPLVGYFVEDRQELAWLAIWRRMDDAERRTMTRLLDREPRGE